MTDDVGFVWPANLMREIRAAREEWRPIHDATFSVDSPVLAEAERAARAAKIPPALRSTPDTTHVSRDLVPLVRAAAAEMPTADVPAIGLDVLRGGSLQEQVDLALVSGYRVEVNRRLGELLGDLDNWKPTGFLNASNP